jgi:hypothetical protein
MDTKYISKVALFFVTVMVAAVPVLALAQFPGSGSSTGNGGVGGGLDRLEQTSEVETLDLPNTREGVVAFIGRLINWALYLAGAIAVVFVIIGGYQYLTSAGNSEGATKGKTTLTNAIIGIIIIILAYVIVNAVVNFIVS